MQDNALENMIPHIETITIYNYFVENWENAIIPTKNILNILDANNLYEAHKDEKTFSSHFTFTQLPMNSLIVKKMQLLTSLFGHFSGLFSLSVRLVFYISVCIMI